MTHSKITLDDKLRALNSNVASHKEPSIFSISSGQFHQPLKN